MSRKLSFNWLGQYGICNIVKDKNTYMPEELNESRLAGKFVGDKLKKFPSQQQLQLDHIPVLDLEE